MQLPYIGVKMKSTVFRNIMKIIDGKKIAEEILLNIKNEVVNLKFQPVFCDVLVVYTRPAQRAFPSTPT